MPVVVPFEQLIDDDPEDDGQHEECHGPKKNTGHIGIRLLETDHHSQYDDADNVIDDGGTHDGLPQFSGQLSHLPEGLYRDADGGCCKDGPDEDRLVEALTSDGGESVEAHIQQGSEDQRDEYSGTGDDGGLCTGFLQVGDICLQTGCEHQDDDPDLGHTGQKVGGAYQVEQAGPDKESGYDLAGYLGSLAFPGKKSEDLGSDNDDRQLPEYV